jgi:small subunit ribosomal protein S6
MAEAAKTNTYEAMFLLGQTATQENEHGVALAKAVVERHGGKILVIKKWDERKLHYEIKGQKRGTYVITYFKAPAKAITPLEREVKLSSDFLRMMVIRADHLNEAEMNAVEPQPIVKEERPSFDRPPFGFGGDGGDRGGRGDRPSFGGGGDRGDRAGDRGDRPFRPRGRDDFHPADAGMSEKQ